MRGSDHALERGVVVEAKHDIAAQQRGEQIGHGAIGDDSELGAGNLRKQMRREVLGAAWIDGADVELAQALARCLDDVFERPVGRSVGNREKHLEIGRDRNRRKFLEP